MQVTILQNIKSLLKIKQRLFYGAIEKLRKSISEHEGIWYSMSFKTIWEKHFPAKGLLKTESYYSISLSEVMSE